MNRAPMAKQAPMIAEFFENLSRLAVGKDPDDSELQRIGVAMLALASTMNAQASAYRRAAGREELVHVLHEATGGPSLYLVSDAAGVRSEPHEHQTWAVIVGLSGKELNVVYELHDAGSRSVKPVFRQEVEAMDVICLPAKAIHSTQAMGAEPTFHLHLYGVPLSELPPYRSRCYRRTRDDAR